MRKNKLFNTLSPLLIIVVTISLIFSFSLTVSAEESIESAENSLDSGEINANEELTVDDGGESISNIFENIYEQVESNADKIFSALAFVGTLIVGIFYKSGLLPLLKDALSKLKGAVDKAKEAEESHSQITNDKIDSIAESVVQMEEQIRKIELGSRDIERLSRERETMRAILTSQVDMLYAIFICSSLPEYQKEEIGLKIQKMREEIGTYEQAE